MKQFALAAVVLALMGGGWSSAALGQELPAAPAGRRRFVNPAAGQTPSGSPSATLSGTVVGTNNTEFAGAKVTLSGKVNRVVTSGANGEFTFTALPAGSYRLKVTGRGMGTVRVPHIVLRAGAVRFVPPVILPLAAASASVRVYAQPQQLAEQQLQLQLHQRVFGILPDYYSSYNWNAVHLWPKQKFKLAFRSEFDPVTFVIDGAVAGIEQGFDRFPGYGQGAEGYARRFGAAYADDFIGTLIGDAALPSLFHQDPRYFYKGKGGFISRAFYAVTRAVICRGDNGHAEPDYSRTLGDFAAGGISNLYYPADDRGAGLVLSNGLIDIGGNAATNLIREFILPGITAHASGESKEKSGIHLF